MIIKKSGPSDLTAVMLITLKHIEAIYLVYLMKYAIKFNFPDLEGHININRIDQATIELCQHADHPVCVLLFDIAAQYHLWITDYIEARSISIAKLMEDERNVIISSNFRSLFFEDQAVKEDLIDLVGIHIFDIAHAMHHLCELVITGDADITYAVLPGTRKRVGDQSWAAYESSHQAEHQLVSVLAEKSARAYFRLVNLKITNK